MSNDMFPELQDLLSGAMAAADRRRSFELHLDLPGDKKTFEAEIKKDPRFTLPAGSIHPYQLWFGFLKAALADPELRVNREFYAPWGPVDTMTFAQWWPEHWRKLFAIDQSIRVAECLEDVDVRDGVIWVRMPLSKSRGALVTCVGRMVDEHQSKRGGVYEQGRFGFDCGVNELGRQISPATRFLRNLDNVDALLWIYAATLRIGSAKRIKRDARIVAIFHALAELASERGRLIKVPDAIEKLVAEFKSRGGAIYKSKYDQEDKGFDTYRRQLDTYLANAEQIARNVAQGQFPGQY